MVHRLRAFIESVKAAIPVCMDAATLFTVCSRIRSTGHLIFFLHVRRIENLPRAEKSQTPEKGMSVFIKMVVNHPSNIIGSVDSKDDCDHLFNKSTSFVLYALSNNMYT